MTPRSLATCTLPVPRKTGGVSSGPTGCRCTASMETTSQRASLRRSPCPGPGEEPMPNCGNVKELRLQLLVTASTIMTACRTFHAPVLLFCFISLLDLDSSGIRLPSQSRRTLSKAAVASTTKMASGIRPWISASTLRTMRALQTRCAFTLLLG